MNYDICLLISMMFLVLRQRDDKRFLMKVAILWFVVFVVGSAFNLWTMTP